jgi:hypothetical protein
MKYRSSTAPVACTFGYQFRVSHRWNMQTLLVPPPGGPYAPVADTDDPAETLKSWIWKRGDCRSACDDKRLDFSVFV